MCYNRGMNLKETENFKFLANLTSFILLVVGLILRDWMFLFAALILKSSTISIVTYHKEQKPTGGFTQQSEEHLANELKKFNIARQTQKLNCVCEKK